MLPSLLTPDWLLSKTSFHQFLYVFLVYPHQKYMSSPVYTRSSQCKQNKYIVRDRGCSDMKIMIFSHVGTISHYLVFNQSLPLIYIPLYSLLFIKML
jgi:hypothetical protein